MNQIAELSEEELKRIIDRGLKNAETQIEDAIDEQVDQSSEKVDRSLEKVTNDKIMAISEYSDTVIESMNKTHNEIMFLYSMLNDKHTELTGMAADLQRLAADVRSLEEKAPLTAPERAAAVSAASAVTPVPVETADTTERETAAAPGRAEGRDAGDGRDKAGRTACRDSEVEKTRNDGGSDCQEAWNRNR